MASMSVDELQKIRGKRISAVFQNPGSTLNPIRKVKHQFYDTMCSHEKCDKKTSEEKAVSLLKNLNLPDPHRILNSYPVQFSGGMNQRIAIARALATEPDLLICDEATSALDVSVQAQIINLLDEIRKERSLSLLFISHDLSLVSSFCSRIAVMYRGKIVEMASSEELLSNPHHPYTKLLLSSVFPVSNGSEWFLPVIADGEQPSDHGCVFCHRCTQQHPCDCKEINSELKEISKDHFCACKIKLTPHI